MVALTSSIFSARFALSSSSVGNLLALVRPGPRIRGICLMRVPEARKESYFLANFLMSCGERREGGR